MGVAYVIIYAFDLHCITVPTNCATRACAWISVPAFGEWDFSDIGRRSESTCAVTRRTNEIKLVSLQAQGAQRNEREKTSNPAIIYCRESYDVMVVMIHV